VAVASFHEFDRFYAISDLHIGGIPGFQIFQQGPLLAALVDWLAAGEAGLRIGLCINGDTLDFLAEPDARYFDPYNATAKLDRMFADPAFAPVFAALRRYVATPNRRLILTLGNHDLELALPWVQEHLLGRLSQASDAARGRITLSLDGAGYRCTVGGKSVLCLHGNEFDPWNVTDHERLRRIGRDVTRGRDATEWVPNAGTKLVIEVMNELKRRYAFVDVLKPEVEAVLPILWVLGEATRPRIDRIFAVSRRLSWDSVRRAAGFLSAGEAPGAGSLELPDEADELPYEPPFAVDTGEMMQWAEAQLSAGTDPLALAPCGAGQLGTAGALWEAVRRRPLYHQAWEAVKDLAHDTTFDLDRRDETFERADQLVDPGLDFLITGHTHKTRALGRERGSGRYFNCGTWASLIRLAPEQLESADRFRPVFERLISADSMEKLGDLAERRPDVVSVVREAGGATTGAVARCGMENGQLVLKRLSG
jgi:UDP-2,3-diacylglucosamine pyrophosphatase LpxH